METTISASTGFAQIVEEEELDNIQAQREAVEEIDANIEAEMQSGAPQAEMIEETIAQNEDQIEPDEASEDDTDTEELKRADNTPAPEPVKPTYNPVLMRLGSPVEFKTLARAISTLVDEATLECTAEGLTFKAMDPSHIALIDVFWPNDAFEVYECDQPTKFAVRIDELQKMLKSFPDKDNLKVELDTEESMLVLSNSEGLEYKTRLIESSASTTPLPKLNFNSKVVIGTLPFDTLLKNIRVSSEYISMDSRNGVVVFAGHGDAGQVKRKFESGMEGLEELVVKEESKATYSLDYIAKFHKAMISTGSKGKKKSIDSNSVTLEYSTKMPIRMEYRIGYTGKIHFYLAPRVQD